MQEQPMGRVVTVLNLKGGVGKTHAVWLLAPICAERGLRMLCIDSLSKIAPGLQQALRQDATGGLSKRHLLAVARLPEDKQEAFVAEVRQAGLTAVETEKAATAHQVKTTPRARYSGGTVRRFAISGATVTIHFRRKQVSSGDLLEVLDKVRQMVNARMS